VLPDTRAVPVRRVAVVPDAAVWALASADPFERAGATPQTSQ
jgi:hypothetical protein